jgi:hypothetical protein
MVQPGKRKTESDWHLQGDEVGNGLRGERRKRKRKREKKRERKTRGIGQRVGRR